MVLQFRHFFFHGIKEKKCYSLIIPHVFHMEKNRTKRRQAIAKSTVINT